jgi:murein DD-endopeptidase MepM/ murein hydrolase activator NlpD
MLSGFTNLTFIRLLSKISRQVVFVGRKVFGHKNLKVLLGGNLALMLIAASFIPTNAFGEGPVEENIIVENKINLTTKVVVQYPVKKIKITQGYRTFHPGIDFDGNTGDEIHPIKDGVVELISNSKYAYGKAIIINHGEDIYSLYAHLSKINVSEGQSVDANTLIGEMGSSGRSSGDHLHLEVRKNGIPVSPYTVLPKPY